jgi:hypothetical protein
MCDLLYLDNAFAASKRVWLKEHGVDFKISHSIADGFCSQLSYEENTTNKL